MSRQTKETKRAENDARLEERLRAILSDGRGRSRATLHKMTEEAIWGPFSRALQRLIDSGEVTRGPGTDREGFLLYTRVKGGVG